VGPTFAWFYGSKGSAALTAFTNPGGKPTTIGGDNELGVTSELGASFRIDKHWFVDAAVFKTFINTTAKLSTGQSTTSRLNPVSINASVGYAF
ncbi:MAG TPA: OmpW family outer membrane protein, partial [Burkholderiaceae bacterium]